MEKLMPEISTQGSVHWTALHHADKAQEIHHDNDMHRFTILLKKYGAY